MIAAIYARKSTEQNDVAEEAKSVERQIDHARTNAAKKGWTVAEDCIFVDDGVSGAEFANRPGFVWLMNAPTPRPARGALLVLAFRSCRSATAGLGDCRRTAPATVSLPVRGSAEARPIRNAVSQTLVRILS